MQFNKFFVHEVKPGTFVLITDAGNWASVSKKELEQINKGSPNKGLLKRLEKKKIILTSKNRKSLERDYGLLFEHLSHGVSLHIINPTMRCNQNCLYCYANSAPINGSGHDMSLETAKKTVDFIWQSPRQNLVFEFQGGEPLANFPAIEFIIGYAKKKRPKKNIHWRIVSNFTMMDGTIASFLKRNNVLDLCTSLDGPQKLHDKNRPLHGGSYKRVVHWINALRRDFGFPSVGVLATITKHSLPFAREIVEEYVSQELPDITPVPLRKAGRAVQNWPRIGFSPQEYVSFWKDVLGGCIESTRHGSPITEQFSLMIARKLLGAGPAFHACFSKPCGAALMQASYQPNGSIYACDEGKTLDLFRLGTVEQPYQEVFASPNALNMVALSSSLGMLCNECKWSAYCCFCPVMAFSSQGSPIPLLYNNADCRIRQAQFSHVFERLFSRDKPVLLQWLKASKSF